MEMSIQRSPALSAAALAAGIALLSLGFGGGQAPARRDAKPGTPAEGDKRSGWKDSFKYYGPNGLWKTWTDAQKRGRDTWIFWTGGNQKFLRLATLLGGRQAAPVSIEYFRMLDSRNRKDRFKKFGLVNEPNCEAVSEPDECGLYLDKWKGDPEGYYPTKYFPDGEKVYGEPTGIVGLRKFKNPNFDKTKWDVKKYFAAPWAMEPPYLVGFSCAFCHMGFNPANPPKDPENPRWENLAANIGNQYFREGDIFFGRGRIIFGDRKPLPDAKGPYDTEGLNAKSLLFHYAVTQQPGTSETSRISYDFINNPNTINSIFYLGNRPLFAERSPDGKVRVVNHVLKDGADSVGIDMALLRVWINIGCEGRYWIDNLFNPASGRRQRPLDLDELRLNARSDAELTPAQKTRREKLRAKYGKDVGLDWAEAHRRNPDLLAYLASYTPYHLANAPGGKAYLLDESKPADGERLDNGKRVFAENCAECHSSKQPMYSLVRNSKQRQKFFRDSVASPEFLANNTLSDDRRYAVTSKDLGTNMARALATNAVDGDIWAELSSKDYKALPPLGRLRLSYGFDGKNLLARRPGDKPAATDITLDFTPPGGGRGYYRTPVLVSMWATAPYLHNNALGDYYVINTRTGKKYLFPNDGRDLLDPDDRTPLTIDPSVEGRMKMFQDAVGKLLWPEKRRYYIKKTETDCRIIELKPIIARLLPGILVELLLDFVTEETKRSVDAYAKDKGLSKAATEALEQRVLAAQRVVLGQLLAKVKPADLAALKDQLVARAKKGLLTVVAEAAGPEHAAALRTKLEGLNEKLEAEARRLQALDPLAVPKGTPVNLYFNLNAGTLPYALKAQLKSHKDRRQFYQTMLMLSDCPDLVEDKGHTYGSTLKEQDKKDLIEFLKTL
jgi:hypothetical protein